MKGHFKKKYHRIWALVSISLFFLGFASLAQPLYHLIKRQYIQITSQKQWAQYKDSPKQSELNQPIVWLKAKDAQLDTLVLYGGSKTNLKKLPTLSEYGSLPNQEGTKIIQAHRDTHFMSLGQLKIGSKVELETARNVQTYQVVDTEILTPERTEKRLLKKKEGDWLALVTCYPFRYIGPAPKRYVVWAYRNKK